MENNEITILPTESVFYREFDTRIKIIKVPRYFHFNYSRFDNEGNSRYRIVKIYRSRSEYDCNFYTSSLDLIQNILTNPELKVTEITQPLNDI